MIRRYLREHLPLAGLLALFAGTFALVLSLYHLPTEPVAYASALCAVMGLIALIWGFVRYRRAHQARAHVLNAPHLLLDELPSPRTLSEADDQAIMQRLLHDVRAETALLILAPSLPFMAVSGAVRGCFLAARRVQPNITAQLIEQLVRMAVAAAGLRTLAQWGAGYGCAAVLLGNTVSESVSCGIMLAFAARTPEFAPRPGAPLHPYTRKELYDILWPVEGSRLLASALQAAESSLIPYTLAIYTGSRAEAVAQYGSLKGMALPLLFFPFSVLGALSGLLMPEITRAHTKGDTAAMRRLIFTMLRMTGAFSLAAGAGFVLLGAPLAGFIYRDAKVGRYVQLLGFVAPFMYLESMVDGVLKGLGEQLATFRYSLFDSVFRIAAIWLVVPQYGMMGFLGVMAVSNLMTCGLNMRRMMKQIKKPSP